MRKTKPIQEFDKNTDPREMPPGTKCLCYARHSPGEDQTIESQLAEILKVVELKGWILPHPVVVDRGVSGTKLHERPGIGRLIQLAKQKPRVGELIIIWDYSRLSRDMDHAQLLRAELRSYGWQLLSLKDNIPPGTLSRLYEVLIDWKNQMFVMELRANTRRGLIYVAERGCVSGGKIVKGYCFHSEVIGTYKTGATRFGRKPEIDPELEPLIVRAFQLKALGATHEAIAEDTGLFPSNSGAWDHFFRNRAYIGEYEFGGQIFPNVYPAMILPELFDAVQKRLPERKEIILAGKNHPRRKASSYILADVGVCGHCGAPVVGKTVGPYRYYVCKRHNDAANDCLDSTLIPAEAMERGILSALLNHVLTESYFGELLVWTNERLGDGLEELEMRLKVARAALDEAQMVLTKMTRNFGLMERPTTTAEKMLHDQEAEVERLHAVVASDQIDMVNSRIEVDADAINQFVNNARLIIQQGEAYALRELCDQLFARIVIGQNECQVELHFPDL